MTERQRHAESRLFVLGMLRGTVGKENAVCKIQVGDQFMMLTDAEMTDVLNRLRKRLCNEYYAAAGSPAVID